MKDLDLLIPELGIWRKLNGNEFSVNDWISYEGNVQFLIAYSQIFWPDFIEFESCIFLRNRFDFTNYENWKKTDYIINFAQIESVLNHIHILDLFATDDKRDEVNYQQILFIGNTLCEIYSAKLKNEFPEKKFIFEFNGDENDLALDEYEITFYQENNLKRLTKYCT